MVATLKSDPITEESGGTLCRTAGVIESGYYAWLKKTEQHAIREEQDHTDYRLLKSIYDAYRGKIGYRTRGTVGNTDEP